jgi:2'-5' RNA ligase
VSALRTFFALALHGPVRRLAERERERLAALPGGDAVRWVRPEGLHVTLRFLGETAESAVPALLERVAAHTGRVPAFPLRLGPARPFPSRRRARVITLPALPEEPLRRLAAAVERGVVEAGFPEEGRDFRPHVTLGRLRRGEKISRDLAAAMTAPDTPAAEAPDMATDATPVNEVLLFRSELSRGGSIYTSIGRTPLGAPGPESPPNH